MSKPRKILFSSISIAGILLCIFIVFLIVSPKLINLETVKEKVKTQYAREIGGDIEYQLLDLALFPRPHVIFSDVKFTMPDNVNGTLESLEVYPKILPLFTGNLQIGMLRSRSPEIYIRLPESSDAPNSAKAPVSIETLTNQLISAIQSLPEFKVPSLALRVSNGRAHFFKGDTRVLALQSVTGRIKRNADNLEFTVTCQSNFWENIAIEGHYAAPGFKIRSQIKLTQFRPHALTEYFFPQSGLRMTNARANLTVDLQTDGPKDLQANVRGAIPYLYLRRGDKELKLTDADFQFGFQLDNKTVNLTLSQLNLKNPRLNLSGQLLIDPTLPRLKLELEGRQINVDTTQKIALALTENAGPAADIFEILRGGEFQRITLSTQGPDLAYMANGENYVIRGSLVDGKIFIPTGQLNLVDVKGDATIANGILEGKNVEARMGNSFAKKGKLALALTENTAPFHIEGLIQADLSQLPSVLTRLIDENAMKKELAQLEKFEGSAVGMLILGEDWNNLNVKIMASDIQLNAKYQRIPYPLKIDGGNLLIDGSRVALTNFNATVGKSSLLQLSSGFEWKKAPDLEISSKAATIDLAELYAWLSKKKTFEQDLKKLTTLDGTVSLHNFDLKGPLLKPSQWRLRSNGDIQNLSMSSALLPGSLTVARGQFTCNGDQLKIKNLNANVGKSSFSGFSAKLSWGKAVMLSASTGRTVVFLDEVSPWLQSHNVLSQSIKDIQPLNGTLAFQNLALDAPIAGKTNKILSLTGAIENWDVHSPKFPTNFKLFGGQLVWQGTRIDLADADAMYGQSTIRRLVVGVEWGKMSSFGVKADSAAIYMAEFYPLLVTFDGLQKAFEGFSATQGTIALHALDVKGPVGRSHSWQFQIAGNLNDLVLESDYLKAPIHIDSAAFAAKDNAGSAGVNGQIDLTDTRMRWQDSHITLQGGAALSGSDLVLDMNLASDRLNWGQIEQITKMQEKRGPDPTMELRGSLRIAADNFTYESYTWRPMHADISFNQKETGVTITKAELCGIQFPGILKVSSNAFEFYFNPVAKNQNLAPSLSCLSDKKNLADGIFNLDGELMAKARPTAFPKSLTGNLAFTADQGRIYRFGMLAKIFALLNVTEIYRGEVPDLAGKGFAYNSMSAKAIFEGGKLIIQESTIDSPSMGIVFEGDIDLVKKKVDLTVLVAPFKTVDRIVKLIPLIGNILGGNLISIPFRAKGDLGDPDVIPLSPTAVGSGLLGIMERTLKLPITIIQPVLPGSKKDKEKDQTKLQ